MRSDILPLLAAFTLLSACGSGGPEDNVAQAPGGEVTIRDAGGAETVIDTEGGQALPEGFDLAPETRIVSNTSVSQESGSGAMVVLESGASPEQLLAFYRREAEEAGIVVGMEMNTGEARMIGGEGANGLFFSFTANPAEGGSTGMMTLGREAQ